MLAILTGLAIAAACICAMIAVLSLRGEHRRRNQPLRSPDDRASAQRGSIPTVSAVIPTLNEEVSLPWVLAQLPSFVSELVLVDGLSTDDTEAIARRLRPDVVVVHQRRPGKGAALRAGFAAATGDIVVMLDGDGSTDPREMEGFVHALQDGADLVKGSRRIHQGGSADATRLRGAGNRVFVAIANILYGSRFTDICYGYCAFWRHHLDALALTADGFEIETQLAIHAVVAGLETREVPSFELARRAGSSHLHAIRDGWRVLRLLLTGPLGHRLATRPAIEDRPILIRALAAPASSPAALSRRREVISGVAHD
jgi:glycosyltransferase involved in cell wall biosynthesis